MIERSLIHVEKFCGLLRFLRLMIHRVAFVIGATGGTPVAPFSMGSALNDPLAPPKSDRCKQNIFAQGLWRPAFTRRVAFSVVAGATNPAPKRRIHLRHAIWADIGSVGTDGAEVSRQPWAVSQ